MIPQPIIPDFWLLLKERLDLLKDKLFGDCHDQCFLPESILKSISGVIRSVLSAYVVQAIIIKESDHEALQLISDTPLESSLKACIEESYRWHGRASSGDAAAISSRIVAFGLRRFGIIDERVLDCSFGSETPLVLWLGFGTSPEFLPDTLFERVVGWIDELFTGLKPHFTMSREIRSLKKQIESFKNDSIAIRHDLRNQIYQAENILSLCKSSEDRDFNITGLRYALNHITELTNHLGDCALALETFDPQSSIEEILGTVRLAYANKGIHFDFSKSGESHFILADKLSFKRIMSNLIINAAKYTDKGFVTVEVRSAGNNKVEIKISDSGKGLSDSQLLNAMKERPPSIFDSSTDGLGINITKKLVAEQRAQMLVESTPDKGTVVTLTFNKDLDGERQTKCVDKPDDIYSKKVNAVVLDDDIDAAESLARVLTSRGIRCSAEQNVNVVIDGMRSEPLTHLLLDLRLKETDAFQVLKQIPSSEKKLKIGVVSGSLSDDDLYKLAALDCDEVFVKPVDCEDLLAWILK